MAGRNPSARLGGQARVEPRPALRPRGSSPFPRLRGPQAPRRRNLAAFPTLALHCELPAPRFSNVTAWRKESALEWKGARLDSAVNILVDMLRRENYFRL